MTGDRLFMFFLLGWTVNAILGIAADATFIPRVISDCWFWAMFCSSVATLLYLLKTR